MKRGQCLPGMAVGSNGTNRPLNSLDAFSANHVVGVTRPSGEDMSLAITPRIDSGVVIVDMVGRLCFLDVALCERVNEWLDEGHRAFVLNLANVSYVDSSG